MTAPASAQPDRLTLFGLTSNGTRGTLVTGNENTVADLTLTAAGAGAHAAEVAETEADAALVALAEAQAAEPVTGERWKAVLVVEGVRTTDHREVGEGSLTWRDLPIPLRRMTEDSHGGVPMNTTVLVGAIEDIKRVDNRYEASGTFDTGADGTEAARLVRSQMQRFVSVDLEVIASELIGEPPMMLLFAEGDAPDEESDWWERVTDGRIMAATMVDTPAFPQAVIVMEDMDYPDVSPDNGLPSDIAASAGADPLYSPPADWFADPHLSSPTHLTVSDDGRVFGHLATWGTRHTSFPDRVVTPPRCSPEYPYFRTGRTRCADGADVPTGVLTLGGGHAPGSMGWRPAIEHYDDAGTAVARVACGEDSHGVWLAGALFPGVNDEQVQLLRALDVSGDWRSIGGKLELVAACVVNVPGFPIPALAASGALHDLAPFDGRTRAGLVEGEQVSLVAAGLLHRDPIGDLRREVLGELTALRSVIEPLRHLAAEELARRIDS